MTFPPHCNRFQMVLEMQKTLNTRGKRSALARGWLWYKKKWTSPTSYESKLIRWYTVNYTHIFMTKDDEIYRSCTNHTAVEGEWWQKSFPTQEHRFQMVLDEILYSKTPWEISSLGRMLPKKTKSPSRQLSSRHFLELQTLQTLATAFGF